MKKRIFTIFIVLMLMMPTVLFAGGGFVPMDPGPVEPPGIARIASQILGAIQVFAFAIAVGMLLFMGVKYMMASADEKANLKQMTINFLIGALIIFGASGIFRALLNLVQSMK